MVTLIHPFDMYERIYSTPNAKTPIDTGKRLTINGVEKRIECFDGMEYIETSSVPPITDKFR